MKKTELNGQLLGLLSNALSKNLFPKPYEGELLSKTLNNGGCMLYFEDSYFNKLDTKIREKYNEGAFARSNAAEEWNNLMITINTASDSNDDKTNLENYWLSTPINKEPIIEIDTLKLNEVLQIRDTTNIGGINSIMNNLAADIKEVYKGYNLEHGYTNSHGFFYIKTKIKDDTTFATSIDLAPLLKLIKLYSVQITSLEIFKSDNQNTINASGKITID